MTQIRPEHPTLSMGSPYQFLAWGTDFERAHQFQLLQGLILPISVFRYTRTGQGSARSWRNA